MKLGNLQGILDLLNPIIEEKCPVKLSLDILGVINEIQPELDKIDKIKKTLVEQFKLVDENGKEITKIDENGNEIYDFGENEEKVNEEIKTLMETEIEIDTKIDINNFDSNIKIEPIKLKILHDLNLLKY